MLFRFSLYGFLKNQQYYAPFLLLVFLEDGLSFTQIGFLIGFREICINLMEVPTGVVADFVGRTKAMMLSFVAYIFSFLIFGFIEKYELLFLAMFLFSIGEAFRTGTHKAIIFSWLEKNNRKDEKTKIYGITRSWSKIGSALSAIISAIMVFYAKDFSILFLFCIIPYLLNLVNFFTYPKYLDKTEHETINVKEAFLHLFDAFKDVFKIKKLRSLFVENLCFEGSLKVCTDYLQTTVYTVAISLPFMLDYTKEQRTAVIALPVFVTLYLLSSIASRKSYKLADFFGSDEKGMNVIWFFYFIFFFAIFLANAFELAVYSIPAFILLVLLQNLWRPLFVSLFADNSNAKNQATMLSIESQGKSLFSAFIAPLVGYFVDIMQNGQMKYLPVGATGLILAFVIFVIKKTRSQNEP